jgi:2-oxoglutarate dehydrogenase E1 component
VSSNKASETLLSGENLPFIEQLYHQYQENPDSVDPSWVPLFREYYPEDANKVKPSFSPRSIFGPTNGGLNGMSEAEYAPIPHKKPLKTPGRSTKFAARVLGLIEEYRLHGHLVAGLDPLGRPRRNSPPELDPKYFGFTDEDMDAKIVVAELFGDREVTLRQVVQRLRECYCGTAAVEFANIPDTKTREWLREQIEQHNYSEIDGAAERQKIYEDLVASDAFETFLHTKYVGTKRFSLTGGDSLIPMMTAVLDEAANSGVEESILGMAHRGRLNVLHNIMGKPASAMLSEFEKAPNPEEYMGSSDVKYHMGYSSDFQTRSGKKIHLSLTFNPSHLEFVNPVVLGRSRAKQDRRGTDRSNVLPILLHGDAAFSGQGIVVESLNLSLVEGFKVNGCIHIVTNNQIGFTATPDETRSTTYCTDISKILEAPIFHVNGDDPEACVRVARLAMRYRQIFKQDVIIDLVCYRRYGHNEGDEPRFTQPVMYSTIDSLSPVREHYCNTLVESGVLSREKADEIWETRMNDYAQAFQEVQQAPKRSPISTLAGVWDKYEGGRIDNDEVIETKVEQSALTELGLKLAEIPESVKAHRTIQRLFKQREEMARGEKPIDWGFAEGLAFASLLVEGTHVRLTGQDVVRATFSQRHAAVADVETNERHWPHRQLAEKQGRFEVYNSILSEAAVLGFEYGYSLDYPDTLVLWEAQFGDFANGAQVIIDQFISSGEDKWKRLSGLVMLLPHGFEGQGPEHSSARLERFLQLAAEDNMYVCNLTTPAQYFHVLRRQVRHPLRKPLIIMTPKSLLRHRLAISELEELATGEFQHVIPDVRGLNASEVNRVLFCSGKVYYDLVQAAEERGDTTTAIVRLEQLYPFDTGAIKKILETYSHVTDLRWVQEEPKNMGSWYFVLPRFLEDFGIQLKYAGRVESASPATGNFDSHEIEQNKLIADSFT